MWDFSIGRSIALMAQTLPFIMLRGWGRPAMSARPLLRATAFVLLSGQAIAGNAYQEAMAGLEVHALDFVRAQGYAPVVPQALTDDQYYSKENFPGVLGATTRLPDADLDPVTRSILILEAQEASLLHARYRVTYSMEVSADVPEAQQAYVEVTRYNMGPARRDELLTSVPDGQVASAAQFGVGPHVSWRFVMAPVMGIRADLMYASRKEIPEAQAQTDDCLGAPCLSLSDPLGPDLDWKSVSTPQLSPPAYANTNVLEIARTARVVQELWASIAPDGMDALPYRQGHPHFVFVVSWNIAGQEAMTSGLLKQALVMDDAIAEIWVRRNEVAQIPANFSRVYVSRR